MRGSSQLHAERRASLRGRLSDADLDAVRVSGGLAAYLVAGPALERKLTTSRHALGEPECPEGVAVVYAAVDWARCGRPDPISGDTLRALWPAFLQAGITPNDERFAIGLEWALRPVAATVALLQGDHGYQAYDYAIRLVREQPAADPPRAQVWSAAIGSATPEEASRSQSRPMLTPALRMPRSRCAVPGTHRAPTSPPSPEPTSAWCLAIWAARRRRWPPTSSSSTTTATTPPEADTALRTCDELI
jgi:hypothetical protein